MKTVMKITASIGAFLVLASATFSYAQTPTSHTLPGGATSVREVFRDWIVECQVIGNASDCIISQEQTQSDGRRLLLINIRPQNEGTVSGTMVLPFGLILTQGVRIQIDEGAVGDVPLPFHTCQPIGCIVEFTLSAALVKAMRAGAALNILSTVPDSKEHPFRIPLGGFSAASERALLLMRS